MLLLAFTLMAGLGALQPASATGVAAAAGTDPLLAAAARFVSANSGATVGEVRFAPLDPRLRVPSCASGWQFDHPFASAETLRAQCPMSETTLFLRVVAGSKPPPPAAAPGPAPTATALASAASPRSEADALFLRADQRRGARLDPSMVVVGKVDPGRTSGQLLRHPSETDHMELLRDVSSDQPLRTTDLRPAVLIRRGQIVTVELGQARNFTVSARLEALEDAGFGAPVRLRNPESGRILTGVVAGPGTARLD